MKRFLSIVLVCLMLIPFSMISVLATTAEAPAPQNAECTASKQNIAGEASVAYNGNYFWALDGTLLVDGKRDNQAHSPSQPNFSWIIKFGKAYEITNIDLYVNGTGYCAKCGKQHIIEIEENPGLVTSVQVIMRNDLGVEVYKSDLISFVEYSEDGDLLEIKREAKIKFAKISVATIEFVVKSNYSYGGALFNEVEVYKEIGEHAWTLDEAKSTPSSCEEEGENVYNCACGAKKEETVPQHKVEEWTVTQQPTTTETGMAEGPCTVPGCGKTGAKALDRLVLSDNEFQLNLDNLTVTEDVKESSDPLEMDNTRIPNESRDKNALFDGVIETDTWAPTNFWCGTSFTIPTDGVTVDDALIGKYMNEDIKVKYFDEKEQAEKEKTEIGKNTLITAEIVQKLKDLEVATVNVYDRNDSTLTVTFDQVYTLTMAELYVWSNDNYFVIEFFGADGTLLKSVDKARYASNDYKRLIFTGEIYGMDVKSVVITIKGAKWPGGKGLAFTELKLGAHKCEFKAEDIAKGTTENCVTTFDAKCIICQKDRVDAKITNHTFEKDTTDPTQDKIVEVVQEVNCYRNGVVKKHCSECDTDVSVTVEATGQHDFDYSKPIYVKEKRVNEDGEEIEVELKPTCGDEGMGYEKCKVSGCIATTSPHVLAPEGDHSYEWIERDDAKSDYTHEGTQDWKCKVCGDIDAEKGTQTSKKVDRSFVSASDWTIRYTDFVSPRATFSIKLKTVQAIEEEGFSVKIYGVVEKGEEIKEVQVYGTGATGTYAKNGAFSLVVKNASVNDEFKFYAKTVITSTDSASTEKTITTKVLTGNSDGTVCATDVARYYATSESRAQKLADKYGEAVKNFYVKLADKAN